MNIGASMAGGNGNRRANDFYPTPRLATVALLNQFGAEVPRKIWEPSCGDGAMSGVLRDYGFDVTSTDLIDRGYGLGDVDFLQMQRALAPAIVTNPPFNLAAQFIEHAFALDVEFMALLLKAQFWHAKTRVKLFERHPPQIIAPLTWRLDFDGRGAPTMDCSWFCWNRSRTDTRYLLLSKPSEDMFS